MDDDHRQILDTNPRGLWFDNSMINMAISYMAADRLSIPANHPRKHSPTQIRQVSRSISAFGFIIPIIVDEANVVLIGVGRLLAARNLGYRGVPAIQVTHLSQAQKTAFTIADNRLTEIANWDDPVLAQQLKDLSVAKIDFDIEVTAFEMAEIDLRIESINLDSEETDPADLLPEEAAGEPVIRTGDIWTLGRHRICVQALSILRVTKA